MPYTDLFYICSDFVVESWPDARGEDFADLMIAVRTEADSFVDGTHHTLFDRDVRAHLRSYFDGYQVEPGLAEREERLKLIRIECHAWASGRDEVDLFPNELAFAIELVVSDVRAQMTEGRWPDNEMANARLLWLLRLAINRQRQAVRRRNA